MSSKKKQKRPVDSSDSDEDVESDEDVGNTVNDNNEDDEQVEKIDFDDDSSEDNDDGDDDDSEDEDDHDTSLKNNTSRSAVPKSNSEKKSDGVEKVKHDDQWQDVRNEIANLSFEELQKLKNKMGLKLFNQVYYGKTPSKPKEIPKRANKNRPQEVSSKKPVKRKIGMKSKVERIRDPRFDERSGEFDAEQFKESYSFVDDIKTREKAKLEKMLSREKNPAKRQKIAYLLNRINQQEDSQKKKEHSLELKRKIKKAERKDVAQGQTPFYLKKSDMKKLELAEKFRELKKSGKLEKFMSKKRKKLAQKDRKKMPVV